MCLFFVFPSLNAEVELNGFVYPLSEGYYALAKQPNIKSCCLNKEQDLVFFASEIPFSSYRRETLRGDLIEVNGKLHLKNVERIEKNREWKTKAVILLAGVLALVFLFFLSPAFWLDKFKKIVHCHM